MPDERAGPERGEVEHADAGERQRRSRAAGRRRSARSAASGVDPGAVPSVSRPMRGRRAERVAASRRPRGGRAPTAARTRPGSSANQPPSTRWSKCGRFSPLPTSATGTRSSGGELDDLGGRPRRGPGVDHGLRSRRGAACGTCPVPSARRRSQSSRPTITQKSSHCCPVVVCNETHPSAVGCTLGSCDERSGRNGSPRSGTRSPGRAAGCTSSASSAATSTRSPIPCSVARRSAAEGTDGAVGARRPLPRRAAAQQRRPRRACRAARDRRRAPGG